MKSIKHIVCALILGLIASTQTTAIRPATVVQGVKTVSLLPKLVAGLKALSARTEKDRANWGIVRDISDSLRCIPTHIIEGADLSLPTAEKVALTARIGGNLGKVAEPLLKGKKANKKIKPLRGINYFAAVCALLVELSADALAQVDSMLPIHIAPSLMIKNRKEYEAVQIVRVLARAIYENLLAGGDFKSINSILANSASAIQLASHIAAACPKLTPEEERYDKLKSSAASLMSSKPLTKRLDWYMDYLIRKADHTISGKKGPSLSEQETFWFFMAVNDHMHKNDEGAS